jgi:LysM repeat protein/ABC-type branched-subunit amino acid transport system substrate-binding protein
MKHILIIIVFTLSFGLNAQNYKTHKVKSGETIEGIAKQYLVTPFDIYALNPDAKSSFGVNTTLIIPNSRVKNTVIANEAKEVIDYKKHKVKRKETLFSLSQKYKVSIDEIKKTNPSLYSENLKRGDRIRIPRFKTVVSKQTLNNTVKKYAVRPSEGKWRIAYKFGITVPELEALNPNINAVIQPGDVLNVPNIATNEEKVAEATLNYYEVQKSEGFLALKRKLGLTQDQLEVLNPDLKMTGLKLGMVLKIPSDIEPVGVSELEDTNKTELSTRITNTETKRIALLLPFRLNRIDLDSVAETKDLMKKDHVIATALDFHSGVLMALDSAKQLGISTHLKVFDTESRTSEIAKILNQNNFSDYDAVIGPMMTQTFDRFSEALKNDRVPLIAPLSKPTKVYDHVFQTIPNKDVMSKKIITYFETNSEDANIVIIADQRHKIISNSLKRTFSGARQIYSELNEKGKDGYFIYPTILQENVFVPGKNIVFLETNSEAFASSIISILNGLSVEDIEIILTTTDKNRAFESNVDNNHLSHLKFHFASPNKSFDSDNPSGFVKDYKRKYGVLPNKYATRGFDLMLDILLRLASSEDNLYESSGSDIETEYVENKFRYSKKLFGGYINEAVYIVKYDNLKIVSVHQPSSIKQ